MTMTVKLIKKHTDAGVQYEPGAILALDDTAAEFLVKAGVAEEAKGGKPDNKAAG